MGWVPTGLAEAVDLGGSAPTVALGTGLSTTAVWAKARPAVLQFGVHMRCLQRYLTDEQHRATVTKALADAVDGLLDQGWAADITVVGYSFGSVVAVDALFPPRWDVRELAVQQPSRLTDAVTRLVTIGWPGSAIELFYRDFYRDRRLEGPTWLNVYIPADVLGTDGATSVDPPHPPRSKPAGAPWPLGPELRPSRSLRYTSETLSWGSLVRARGLRSHGGYWDTAQRDSCFRMLLGAGWLPEPAATRSHDTSS
jgi:hypothetical protein